MRQVLIEHAREQLTAKRGNRVEHIDVADAILMSFEESQELVLLHEALLKLAKTDERKARIVEHRYFGGFTLEEIAELLGVSQSTIEREWRLARAWLKREMCAGESH
jgi:RNA polymerase sigma factor (TIGR02999 family)